MVNVIEYYCKQVSFMVIGIHTFVTVGAGGVSFPATFFFSYHSLALSAKQVFLKVFLAALVLFILLARALEAVEAGTLPVVEAGYRIDKYMSSALL
jgi:uncharacterized membrane-anchored protein